VNKFRAEAVNAWREILPSHHSHVPTMHTSRLSSVITAGQCKSHVLLLYYGFLVVQRPTSIKVQAQDVNGKRLQFSLNGWAARVFQHEYDHLSGVLFPDRMKLEHLEREKDKVLALEQAYRDSHPNSSIVSIVSTRLAWDDAKHWKDRT
jgi:hypothetical protein